MCIFDDQERWRSPRDRLDLLEQGAQDALALLS